MQAKTIQPDVKTCQCSPLASLLHSTAVVWWRKPAGRTCDRIYIHVIQLSNVHAPSFITRDRRGLECDLPMLEQVKSRGGGTPAPAAAVNLSSL